MDVAGPKTCCASCKGMGVRACGMKCELGISPSPAVAAAFGRFLRRLADTPVSTEGARLTRATRPTTFSLTLLLPAVFLSNAPAGG